VLLATVVFYAFRFGIAAGECFRRKSFRLYFTVLVIKRFFSFAVSVAKSSAVGAGKLRLENDFVNPELTV